MPNLICTLLQHVYLIYGQSSLSLVFEYISGFNPNYFEGNYPIMIDGKCFVKTLPAFSFKSIEKKTCENKIKLGNKYQYNVQYANDQNLCRGEFNIEVHDTENPDSFKIRVVVVGIFAAVGELVDCSVRNGDRYLIGGFHPDGRSKEQDNSELHQPS